MDKTPQLSENAAPDRRALPDRRAQRTRQTLSHALVALIQEKRYDAITVQDICDRANVGRSTFYAHYQDKDDLLASNFSDVMKNLSQPFAERDGQLIFPLAPLFEHTKSHQELYKALLWGGGIEVLMHAGQRQWSEQITRYMEAVLHDGRQPTVPIPVLAAYMAGSLYTLLFYWLDHKLPYSPERMDEIFQQLVMPGVNAALRA
jgi:AcrR family transcriptional regulator